MISSDFNKNVLPQFDGPTIITSRNLLLPRASKSHTTSANTHWFILFSWSTCLGHSYITLRLHFISICIVVVFVSSMEAFALFIFQVFSMRSLRDLLDLDHTKVAKSNCSCFFLLFASQKSSVSRCILLFAKNSLTSNWVRRFLDAAFLFFFCGASAGFS